MSRHTVFVKISGNLIARSDVLDWIRLRAEESAVTICTGGGSQINEAFKARGFEIKFGPLGRETKTFEERQFARDILENNQVEMEDLLAENKISAIVEIPVRTVGSVLCPVNGDLFVKLAYLGFDELYVLTLSSRVESKQKQYELLPKITVVGFPDENP